MIVVVLMKSVLKIFKDMFDQCGFTPVMCGNEGCRMVVNKRDKEKHEKSFCQFRIAKCQGCRVLEVSQDEKGKIPTCTLNSQFIRRSLQKLQIAT